MIQRKRGLQKRSVGGKAGELKEEVPSEMESWGSKRRREDQDEGKKGKRKKDETVLTGGNKSIQNAPKRGAQSAPKRGRSVRSKGGRR